MSELRHIPIRECGEPLVDYRKLSDRFVLGFPPFQYRRETLARESVVAALVTAAGRLPKDLRLGITEGWRAPHIQRRMYLGVWQIFAERHPDWSETKLKRVVNRYTAPINNRVPPPHSTGGAVDVFLVGPDGKRMSVSTPFDPRDPHGFSMDAAGLAPESVERRQILKEIFTGTVLTNYPSEWWHWSYGDQGWAYRGREEFALYAPIEPAGWEPDPNDVSDQPFEFIEGRLEETE